VDPVGDVGDGGARLEGDRFVLGDPVRPEADADQAGQPPDRLAETVQAPVVEHRHVDAVVVGQNLESLTELVGLRAHQDRALLDPGRSDLALDDLEGCRRLVRRVTKDDRVRVPKHAEQRAAAATVLVRALDQAGDLDELDEHAADPSQCRDRAKRRERIVAGLDPDVR